VLDEDRIEIQIAALGQKRRLGASVEEGERDRPAPLMTVHDHRVRETLLGEAADPGPSLEERNVRGLCLKGAPEGFEFPELP